MKKVLINLAIVIISLNAFSQVGFQWAQTSGHPFYGETTTRLAADTDGNVFVAGGFIDTAAFGTRSIVSNGGADFFIAKHNAAGETLWLAGDGGTDYEKIHGVSVSHEGVFVCGTFYGTCEIGAESFPSMGSQDIFLASYDLEGNFSWAKHIGSPKTDYIKAVCNDPDGNMFITGYFYDSISFGDTSIYAHAGSDIFIAKYSSSGDLTWLRQASGSSSDQSYSISCNEAGDIIFTGSFFDDILVIDTFLTTEDPTGVFMAKMTNDGDLIYARQVDGNGLIAQSFASFDNDGDIFFTGNFTDQVTFGTHTFDAGAFNIDIFVTKYTADGDLVWAEHGYGLGSDQLISVSAGPDNDFYITGHFLHDIHFGNIMLEYTLCCGSAEIFLVRFTADGTAAWGDQISGERAMVESLCKNANDELFVSGLFQFQLTFGEIIIEGEGDYNGFLSGVATGTMISVEELEQTETFTLYPVPANDRMTLDVKSEQSLNYTLYDMTGRSMLNGIASGSHSIDISAIPAGQYLLRVYDTSSGVSEGRLILKK